MSKITLVIWLVTAAVELLLVTQPVGAAVQMALAISIIVALAAIWILRLGGAWRHVFLALATIVVLRYAFWRTTSTLPPANELASFIPGVILYAAEMYCIVMLAISLFVVSDPKRRSTAPAIEPAEAPTIDVFIPSYNESSDLLALTLAAAKAMVYPGPKVKVFLLDDGATDAKLHSPDLDVAKAARHRAAELKTLCKKLGVNYHARRDNTHAKAGNLNAGLGISSSELVIVFDADHAPERNFLIETVGFFAEDPDLFLVQTPHFFSNPDPIERNLGTFENMPSENEMFYGKIQQGLDRWNASFFCGSAAVLRREALEEAGGFSGITITEDCETALELHSRGWNSVYVDKPLITGLQPDTLSAFIGQRSRWCQGMVQILLLKNPLLRRGLSLPQRVGYLSSALFWLFPLMRAVFFIAPLLFILFNLKIYVSSLEEFTAYTVTYLIVCEMIRSYLYGSVRWPWVSELYEYVQSVYLLRAIVSVVLSPKRPTFNVTAKSEQIKHDHISELALPYFLIFAVSCVAMFVCAYRYQTEPEISGLLAVVGLWQFINLVMAGAALGVVTERSERRAAMRASISTEVVVSVGDKQFAATISDVSTGGAALTPIDAFPEAFQRGQVAMLRLSDPPAGLKDDPVAFTIAEGASDRPGDATGIVFRLAPEDYRVIAHLMLSDMSPVREQRRLRQRGRLWIRVSLNVIVWAVSSPFSFIALALTGNRSEPAPARAQRRRSTRPVSLRKPSTDTA